MEIRKVNKEMVRWRRALQEQKKMDIFILYAVIVLVRSIQTVQVLDILAE